MDSNIYKSWASFDHQDKPGVAARFFVAGSILGGVVTLLPWWCGIIWLIIIAFILFKYAD